MPQQINLIAQIQVTHMRYFSAKAMAQALAVMMVFGGSLYSYGLWNLSHASEGVRRVLRLQINELESLQIAIQQSKSGMSTVTPALMQALQAQQTELWQHQQLLDQLQRGVLRPGLGHSTQLQLIAQTIPVQIWITKVNADESHLDISGFTLEPSALNEWIGKLAISPILKGQKLIAVKVENMVTSYSQSATDIAMPPPSTSRPVWSFSISSAIDKTLMTSKDTP